MNEDERRLIRQEVLRLAWPVVLQNFIRTLMFLMDTALLKELGPTAIASMGIVGPVTYTLISIFTAISIGTIALVARATGEGDRKRQTEAAATALIVALISGLGVGVAAILFLPRAAELLGQDNPTVIPGAQAYLGIIAWSLPILLVDLATSSIFRAAGDTRTPLLIAIAGNAINLLLSLVLIFGWAGFPRLEIRGAALGTQIGLGFQGALTLALLFTKRSPLQLSIRDLAMISRQSLNRFLTVTWPALVEPLVLRSGFLVYTRLVADLGEISLAAHRSAIAVESISFMPGFGVGVATSAIIGQYLGAKRQDAAERGLRESIRLGLLLMGFIGLLLFCIPHVLLWPFTPDHPTVESLAAMALRIAAFEQPFMAMAMVLGGALRGAGDTRSPVFVGFVGVWIVRVPLTYLLAHILRLGLVGVWITMALDWGVQTFVFGWIYRKGKWKNTKL